MNNPFSTGWQWSVKITRAVLCVVIVLLGIQLAVKMAYVFGPDEPNVASEPSGLPDFNFAAAPFTVGQGTWELNSHRGMAFLDSVSVDDAPEKIAGLCKEHLSLELPTGMVQFSDSQRQVTRKEAIDQHQVSIIADRNRILLAIDHPDKQFNLLAIKLSPVDCLISLAANQNAESEQSERAAAEQRDGIGLGLKLPGDTTVIAARSTPAGEEDAQIVGVADFEWDELLKMWKTDGWTIETNPLANHNEEDAFCIKLPQIIRVWTIGEDEGRTILVITKLNGDSA